MARDTSNTTNRDYQRPIIGSSWADAWDELVNDLDSNGVYYTLRQQLDAAGNGIKSLGETFLGSNDDFRVDVDGNGNLIVEHVSSGNTYTLQTDGTAEAQTVAVTDTLIDPSATSHTGTLADDPHGSDSHDDTVADDPHGSDSHDDTVAELDADGVLLSSQVPDLAITETYTVADETERLALDVQEGDVALQTDESTAYLFTGGDPSVDSNWSQILYPDAPVTTVFGRTGDVVAESGDYAYSDISGTHGDGAHSLEYINDGDGTKRELWIISSGASDPSGAANNDLILEEE